jgi:cytochrome c-type biogenesis protein
MAGLALSALFGLAFSAGTVTFFAPCAFPLLPGYLSYFLGDTVVQAGADPSAGTITRRVRRPLARAALISVAASLGITLVYVGLAGTTAALGARALADIAVLEAVVGGVFLLAGVAVAAGWRGGVLVHVQLPERRRSVIGFFLFGVLYAGAAAGCTAPLFLAVVAKGLASAPAVGVGLAVAYALGMSVVLTALTGVSALGGSSAVSVLREHTDRIYRASGVLLAASGVAEIYYFFYGFPEVLPR